MKNNHKDTTSNESKDKVKKETNARLMAMMNRKQLGNTELDQTIRNQEMKTIYTILGQLEGKDLLSRMQPKQEVLSPLEWAISHDRSDIVRAILSGLDTQDLIILIQPDQDGYSALEWAIFYGRTDIVTLILSKLDSTDLALMMEPKDEIYTPLELAIVNGKTKIVKAMLERAGKEQSFRETMDKNMSSFLKIVSEQHAKNPQMQRKLRAALSSFSQRELEPSSVKLGDAASTSTKNLSPTGEQMQQQTRGQMIKNRQATSKPHVHVDDNEKEEDCEDRQIEQMDQKILELIAMGQKALNATAQRENDDKKVDADLNHQSSHVKSEDVQKGDNEKNLSEAIQNRNIQGAKAILEKLDQKDLAAMMQPKDTVRTPLEWAIVNGYPDIVTLLLERAEKEPSFGKTMLLAMPSLFDFVKKQHPQNTEMQEKLLVSLCSFIDPSVQPSSKEFDSDKPSIQPMLQAVKHYARYQDSILGQVKRSFDRACAVAPGVFDDKDMEQNIQREINIDHCLERISSKANTRTQQSGAR